MTPKQLARYLQYKAGRRLGLWFVTAHVENDAIAVCVDCRGLQVHFTLEPGHALRTSMALQEDTGHDHIIRAEDLAVWVPEVLAYELGAQIHAACVRWTVQDMATP